jgi:hypothetical protein
MFKTYCKTVLISICTFVLFGCSGEADEAKKLGFGSVDEMKEAHAKGWHTQQQYYKDESVKVTLVSATQDELRCVLKWEIANTTTARVSVPIFSGKVVNKLGVKGADENLFAPKLIGDKLPAGSTYIAENRMYADCADIAEFTDIVFSFNQYDGEIRGKTFGRSGLGIYSFNSLDKKVKISWDSQAEERKAAEKVAAEKVAAEKKAAEKVTAESKATSPSAGPANWEAGKEYSFYNDGSCRDQESKVCVTESDFRSACRLAKGITTSAHNALSVFGSNKRKALASGGTLDSVSFSWSDSTRECRVSIVLSGIFEGTSARETVQGWVGTFVVSQSSKNIVALNIATF